MNKQKVNIITGVTGSGKTKKAIQQAQNSKSLLINADSRQIYIGNDIGSNKGEITFKSNLHIDSKNYQIHQIEESGTIADITLISFEIEVGNYSIFKFYEDVRNLISYCTENTIVPIIVGGSGMYIDILLHPEKYDQFVFNGNRKAILSSKPVNELQDLISSKHPKLKADLNNSDWNNIPRLVSNILREESQKTKLMPIDVVFEVDYLENDSNPEMLAKRVTKLLEQGWIDEVNNLRKKYSEEDVSLLAIGNNSILNYLKGQIAEEALVEEISRQHLNYTKKQKTWFKKHLD